MESGRNRQLASLQDATPAATACTAPSVPHVDLRVKQRAQALGDGGLAGTVDDFLQKAVDDEALRVLQRDAARAQVEQLLGVDLSAGRAVGAADIVGFDLEAGEDRAGRVVARVFVKQIARGVWSMRAEAVQQRDVFPPRPRAFEIGEQPRDQPVVGAARVMSV